MKILAKQNRELIMINAQNTQNENDAEKIILQVPEQYEDFNKKIVFVTSDGIVWDIITNNEYLIKKAITKYQQVDFYIWLTKGEVDFRTQTKTLKFYHNVDASEEITDEEIGRVNTVINLLEDEITKVENLETEIDGKLEEIDTAIDNANTAIQEVENLNVDAEKVGQTTTITLTKKNGTTKVVHVDDGVDLQFMWQGTSLGIKTAEQEEYTFVNLQGIQGEKGEMGEPFTIKRTYSSVAEMNADFNNMQLGDYVMIASTVEVEDNAKLYTKGESQWIFITDFSGATGIRGEAGLTPNIQIGTVTQGTSFNITRTGTNENPVLNFTLVKGDKGDKGDQGIPGVNGTNGQDGQDGYTPVRGVDYWTDEDIAGIENHCDDYADEIIADLEEQVEDLQNNQLQGSESGTSIDLNDSADSKVKNIEIYGNSEQNTTTGKNLYNAEESYSFNNNSAKWVFVNGNSGASGTNIGTKTELKASVTNGETYTFKVGTLITNATAIQLVYGNETLIKAFNTTNIKDGFTFTSIQNGVVLLRIYAPANDNISISQIQLEKGSMPTDYEPYTNGASPNPSYPQEVKSAGDNGYIVEKFTNSDNTRLQTYTIPCQQPMRAIGDVKDTFIKVNDVWYERHYISRISSYNGEEITTAYMSTTGELSTGATVDYVLETPLDLPCTQAQITALEALMKARTYKNITHIYSEDEVPATVDLTYYKDTQTEINNKATKEYVDNLFNSIIDGDEVSY